MDAILASEAGSSANTKHPVWLNEHVLFVKYILHVSKAQCPAFPKDFQFPLHTAYTGGKCGRGGGGGEGLHPRYSLSLLFPPNSKGH